MRLRSAERGDTIIEVIFAIVIFSFVAISTIAIMNQGIATGERALEITLVRQQINAQAEALRFVHSSRVSSSSKRHTDTWNSFKSEAAGGYKQSSASEFGVSGNTCSLPGGRPFIMNARTADVWSGNLTIDPSPTEDYPPYPQVVYGDSYAPAKDNPSVTAAYGMWIEAVPSDTVLARRFIDFHIRACWAVPGSAVPMTIGTIVRLYDPS